MNNIPVITIDGPSGSGKGTIGQLLAKELEWHYLDSGVIYRAVAFVALAKNIAVEDTATLVQVAQQLALQFEAQPYRVLLDNQDVTEAVRHESCGTLASKIAALAPVRDALLERQRQFRQPPGLVTDGRDMGSVVFPDAPAKFFLSASAEERAQRRYKQLKAAGINVSLNALCQELIERDRRDQQRLVAPLKPTPDAIVVDTTGLTIIEVLQLVKAKALSQLATAKGIT